MSFEEIAPIFGISNMTLRRWGKSKKDALLSKSRQAVIREGVYQLLIDGRVKSDSKNVEAILKDMPSKSFESAIKSLGVDDLMGGENLAHQDRLAMVLAQIGHNSAHMSEVKKQQSNIIKFKKFGKSWSNYITTLIRVIRSREIHPLDKFVAYGALFYLIWPFDLIPDSIPIIGYLDDFAFLAVASAYYAKKYPNLIDKEGN